MNEEGYVQTSVYVTAEDRRMMEELQSRTGLTRSAVVRLAVQRMFAGDGGERQARLLEIADELRTLA